MSDRIVYLVVQSYDFVVSGAIHFYGYLQGADSRKRVDLHYNLTPSQAAKFNKREGATTYKAGDRSGRFVTEEKLKKVAAREYKKHFPDAEILLKGRSAYIGPKWVVDGPKDVYVTGRNLYLDAEELGWWDNDPKDMEDIVDEWNKLIEPYTTDYVPEPLTPVPLVEEPTEEITKERRPNIDEWYETHNHREIELKVRCRTTFDEDTGSGFLNFFMGVCDVSDDEGNNLGSVKSCTSASIWLNRAGEHSWRIGADDLWYAFIEALEAAGV